MSGTIPVKGDPFFQRTRFPVVIGEVYEEKVGKGVSEKVSGKGGKGISVHIRTFMLTKRYCWC